MSEGVHPACRDLCTPFSGRRYAGVRWWGNLPYVRGIISLPLQSPVPLPSLHRGPLSLHPKAGSSSGVLNISYLPQSDPNQRPIFAYAVLIVALEKWRPAIYTTQWPI